MAKYIDREAAILAAMDYEGRGNAQDASMDIASAIGDIPTADVRENVKGEWLFEEYPDGYYHSECSSCGFQTVEDAYLKQWKFCHNCGAQMMGGAEDG